MQYSYKDGREAGDWIVWDKRQDTDEDKMLHMSYFLAGIGFENTQRILLKIVKEKFTYVRSNLRISARKGGDDFGWSHIQGHFSNQIPYAFSYNHGAYPFMLWQNHSTGMWTMGTGYGIAHGIRVEINKKFEWRLRSSVMFGWIHFLGKNVRGSGHGSINDLLLSKETEWSWDNLSVEVWGYTDMHGKNKSGVNIGGVYVRPFERHLHNMMRVGGVDVIQNMAPTYHKTGKWKKWLVEEMKKGKCIAYADTDGRIRYQYGFTRSMRITEEQFIEVNEHYRVKRKHSPKGYVVHEYF